uniref:Reverse transcriptase domain-containing protein n=1 Tax=Panagrellus redivivus TaxID=6233 RepID=A0A7E4V5X0_PANRE
MLLFKKRSGDGKEATFGKTVKVCGNSSKIVKIKVPGTNTVSLIDGCVPGIESGVVESKDGWAFVRITNKDDFEKVYQADDRVGDVVPVDVVDDWADMDTSEEGLMNIEKTDAEARISQLEALLDFGGCDLDMATQRKVKDMILEEFADIFAVNESEHGRTDLVAHGIETGESKPIRLPSRNIPIPLKEKAKAAVAELVDNGIVEESTSPWCSQVVLVRKKDGSLRLCVDYRKLNSLTKKDAYPLPNQDSMLFQLNGMKYFSTMDFYSGYYQIPLEDDAKEKTAFSMLGKLYQFKVVPMGLTPDMCVQTL